MAKRAAGKRGPLPDNQGILRVMLGVSDRFGTTDPSTSTCNRPVDPALCIPLRCINSTPYSNARDAWSIEAAYAGWALSRAMAPSMNAPAFLSIHGGETIASDGVPLGRVRIIHRYCTYVQESE